MDKRYLKATDNNGQVENAEVQKLNCRNGSTHGNRSAEFMNLEER